MTGSVGLRPEVSVVDAFRAVAAAVPERTAIVHRRRRWTYAEFADRVQRAGRVFRAAGLGVRAERDDLEAHESGQDVVAIDAHNGIEWLEALLGAFAARVAPANVNHRYTVEELDELFSLLCPSAVVHHRSVGGPLLSVLARRPGYRTTVWTIDDGSGTVLGPDWDEALDRASPSGDGDGDGDGPGSRPDDLYILCTGGTTGRPKGVLWRQADALVAAFGVAERDGTPYRSAGAVAAAAAARRPRVVCPAPPFMHGAAQWMALQALCSGHTVVIQDVVERFDPADVWDTVEREGVEVLQIVGDAFAVPLLEEIRRRPRDLATLTTVVSGGAPLQPAHKAALLGLLGEGGRVRDSLGASETGLQARHTSTADRVGTGRFRPGPTTRLVDARLRHFVAPPAASPGGDGALPLGRSGAAPDGEPGWLAQTGPVPLGYLDDPDATARTFPVIDGVRVAVPGDRARWCSPDEIELLGRDSVTIVTGGEKVFAEEVEAVVKTHPEVADAVVCGIPSPRWGSEVAVVVALSGATVPTQAEMAAHCRRRLAGYKVPRHLVVVDEVRRSAAGKPDYRWATATVESELRRRGARGRPSTGRGDGRGRRPR